MQPLDCRDVACWDYDEDFAAPARRIVAKAQNVKYSNPLSAPAGAGEVPRPDGRDPIEAMKRQDAFDPS